MDWQAVGLNSDPFRVVPPAGPTSQWLGRPALRSRLESIARSWQVPSRSTLYLVWAYLGAGKTHALRYVEYLALQINAPAIAIYADLTQAPDSFVDIFERIVRRIPEQVLADSIRKFRILHESGWLDAPELAGDRQTPQALWVLAEASDSPPAEVVRTWLRCATITRTQGLTAGGITTIRDADQAVRILVCLVHIVLAAGHYGRFVLMLDEYQRLAQISKRKKDDINAAVKAVYDQCPEGLTIFLTYSFGTAEHIRYMTSDELRDRVETRLQLPPLTLAESTGFLEDLIASHSSDSSKMFRPAALAYLVNEAAKAVADKLTPRGLMQAARGVVMDAFDQGIDFPLTVKAVKSLYQAPGPDGP